MARHARDIFAGVLAALGAILWERVANLISVAMMLLAIAYVVAIGLATVLWIGSKWLPLTMPIGILLGVPAMRVMARFSQHLTDEPEAEVAKDSPPPRIVSSNDRG